MEKENALFAPQSESTPSGLDEIITLLLDQMKMFDAESDEYAKCVDHLDTLYKLKLEDKPKRLSRDSMALVAGNLAGIVLIILFEKEHVMTSKALSMLLKITK